MPRRVDLPLRCIDMAMDGGDVFLLLHDDENRADRVALLNSDGTLRYVWQTGLNGVKGIAAARGIFAVAGTNDVQFFRKDGSRLRRWSLRYSSRISMHADGRLFIYTLATVQIRAFSWFDQDPVQRFSISLLLPWTSFVATQQELHVATHDDHISVYAADDGACLRRFAAGFRLRNVAISSCGCLALVHDTGVELVDPAGKATGRGWDVVGAHRACASPKVLLVCIETMLMFLEEADLRSRES